MEIPEPESVKWDAIFLPDGKETIGPHQLRSRIVREGEAFWLLLNRQHMVLIRELLDNNKETEGCFGIHLGDDSISFKAGQEFDANNIKPNEAILQTDRSFREFSKKWVQEQ